MTIVQRILRERVAIVGLIGAVYGLLVAFDVLVLTAEQVGAVTAFGGAVFAALRFFVTPAEEVVAQQKPGQVVPTSGPALGPEVGQDVHVTRILGKA